MDNNGKQGNLKTNWQEHDLWYAVDRVQETYWREPWQLIQQVVALCKAEVKPAEGRERLLGAAKEKMRLLIEARGEKPDT